ncbi:MAG: nickel-dependent hydrogenase large subunit, partial [Gammaproteobacteria bacterium]
MASTVTPNGFSLDDSGQRVVVDPICRIEGHLRIEVNLDETNTIRNAVSTGNMWRGLEVILKGRDPRDAWAFVERICGVCTGVHALASVRTVEDALGIDIPRNANSIRNLMMLAQYTQDHLVHFYHLHALDWVDVVSALSADPGATSQLQQSISSWRNSSPGYFRDVQNKLKRFVESGQLGPFANAYWGSDAYRLPPEANLMAVAHYLEALDFQKEIVKIHTIFGGRNPHPNWIVGGVPCSINVDQVGATGTVHMVWLNMVSDIINQSIEFIDKVYIPDLKAIASFYLDWGYGGGLAGKNMMSYGDFPIVPNDWSNDNLMLPAGAIVDGDLSTVHEVDPRDPEQIQEFVNHSWYSYDDEKRGLHPWDGVTEPNFKLGPNFKGTKTKIEALDEGGKYSWLKAPRWKGHAMEVGPLSRFVIAYALGREDVKELVDSTLSALGLPLPALFSTLGRTAARGLECTWSAHKMREVFDDMMANIKAGDVATANMDKWEPSTWPRDVKGVGRV